MGKVSHSIFHRKSNSTRAPVILFISVRSDIGGGPKHLYDLTSSFIKLHADWKIIIAAPEDIPFGPKFQQLAHKFIPIPARKWSLILFFKLLHNCRKQYVNIIHSHGRGAGFYSRLLSLFGFKIVHTFHGINSEPSIQGKVKLFLDRLLSPLTDFFICVSNDEREYALSRNLCKKKNSYTIYNGIDVVGLHSQVKKVNKKDCRTLYKISPDSFVLGTLSRLHYQKGLDLLIPAFKKLLISNRDRKYILLIAGAGEEKDRISSMIQRENMEEHVQLIGNVFNISFFLGTLDCYVSFARWEGMPISLVEAMSAELPCVVSNVIGNRELIRHGQNGFMFELNEPEGFYKAVTTLEQNPSLRKNAGFKAYKHVLKNHSLEEMTLKTTDVYKKYSSVSTRQNKFPL